MARSIEDIPPAARSKLVVGIDWGFGGISRTVVVIGFMEPDYRFRICRFERFPATEEPDVVLRAVLPERLGSQKPEKSLNTVLHGVSGSILRG